MSTQQKVYAAAAIGILFATAQIGFITVVLNESIGIALIISVASAGYLYIRGGIE